MDLNSSQANNYSSHHFFSSSWVDIDSGGSKYVAFYAELDLNLFGSKLTKGSFLYLIGIAWCLVAGNRSCNLAKIFCESVSPNRKDCGSSPAYITIFIHTFSTGDC